MYDTKSEIGDSPLFGSDEYHLIIFSFSYHMCIIASLRNGILFDSYVLATISCVQSKKAQDFWYFWYSY